MQRRLRNVLAHIYLFIPTNTNPLEQYNGTATTKKKKKQNKKEEEKKEKTIDGKLV